MIYRLRGPSREKIEQRIPFDLYREDEDGQTHPVFATQQYSYHFIGKEVIEEAEYSEDGEMTNPPSLSEYVLADLRVYDETNIEFPDEVEVLTGISTPMHGWS